MTAPAPEYGGCPWPIDPACLGDEWEALDPTVQARSVALASSTLYRLTGFRVGGCPITVRPCVTRCDKFGPGYYMTRYGHGWMSPYIGTGGQWVNSCGCLTDCACTELCEVRLPGPVGEVYAVTVGDTVLPATDYRVDGTSLVYTGASDPCPWPACQDLSAPVGAPGTFAVEYLNSYPVDALGAYAAGTLAWEFSQACVGNKCRLPASVTSVSRQGVTFDIAPGMFPDGFTGIREVDAYIATVNPGALRQQSQVWSPDIHTPRVVR